jgi:hypothetical protein
MDTKRIMQAVGGGFVGFLVLLCAHGVLLYALMASISLFSGPRISPLSWSLFIFVIPPLATTAAAIPAIRLGAGKKFSLTVGFVAFILAAIIVTHPLEKSGGLFNMTSTLASIALIGVTMLAASFRSSGDRKMRVGILLGIWAIFLILGAVVANFSQIAGFFAALSAWIVLPGTVAILQSR